MRIASNFSTLLIDWSAFSKTNTIRFWIGASVDSAESEMNSFSLPHFAIASEQDIS